MTDFVTSDPHFYHSKILTFQNMNKYRGDLYHSVEEMNEDIIDKTNSVVGEDDRLFILGDFCFGQRGQLRNRVHNILSSLRAGKIILVRGNHDVRGSRGADDVFKEFGHEIVDYNETTVSYGDQKHMVVMMHYPITQWNRRHYGSVHLFGHCHGMYDNVGKSLDVGWDKHGRILSLKEAVEMANAKPQ